MTRPDGRAMPQRGSLGYLAVSLLLLAAFWSLGAPVSSAFDPTAMVLAIGVPLLVVVGLHGPAGSAAALVAGLREAPEPAVVSTHLQVLSTARRTALAGGAVGLLVGVLRVLRALPDLKDSAPAMATAACTVVWALVFGELFAGSLGRRLGRSASSRLPLPGPGAAAGLVGAAVAAWLPLVVLLGEQRGPATAATAEAVSTTPNDMTRTSDQNGITTFRLRTFSAYLRCPSCARTEAGPRVFFGMELTVKTADADSMERILQTKESEIRSTVEGVAGQYTLDLPDSDVARNDLKFPIYGHMEVLLAPVEILGFELSDFEVYDPRRAE